MEKEKTMTEKQFVAKFKKEGYELYKTSEIKRIYKKVERIEKLVKEIV